MSSANVKSEVSKLDKRLKDLFEKEKIENKNNIGKTLTLVESIVKWMDTEYNQILCLFKSKEDKDGNIKPKICQKLIKSDFGLDYLKINIFIFKMKANGFNVAYSFPDEMFIRLGDLIFDSKKIKDPLNKFNEEIKLLEWIYKSKDKDTIKL